MTEAQLKAMIKEVAGEVYAETFAENTAKGKELRERGLAGVLDMQQALMARSSSGAGEARKGDRFFRTMGAVAQGWRAGGGHDVKAQGLAWVKSDGRFKSDATLEKDLSSVLQTGGAVLIQEELSEDFIEFLRPAIVLGALGARDVPMQSTELVIPAHTIGSTGGWIGEGDVAPVTAPGFGAVEMRLRTYASIVPVPIDLMRYAFINAEAFVATDMRLDIASAFDMAYLRGSGANGQPLGIRFRGNVTRTSSGASAPDLNSVTVDLLSAFERMGEANLPMQKIGWGMSWRSWRYLMGLRNSLGVLAFGDEMRMGTLMGAKFKASAAIKNNFDPYASGTANNSELYVMDLDTVLLGRADGVQVYVSQDGAYETASGVKSALSRNQIVVRAVSKTDVQVRYRDGVQIIDGLLWT